MMVQIQAQGPRKARTVACKAAGVTEAPPDMKLSSGGAGKRVMIVGALLTVADAFLKFVGL